MPRHLSVGLIMATELEAAPFIEGMALTETEREPFSVYQGEGEAGLILSGIGKANAAMACAYLLQRHGPQCILNLGAAGATDGRANMGKNYHVNRVIEPDRPHLRTGTPHEQIPDVLDGLPVAALATQDRPVKDPAHRAAVALQAELVDMEGASVVQTARRFRVPCYLFKFVSDSAGHTESSEIETNIRQYRQAFYAFFKDHIRTRL